MGEVRKGQCLCGKVRYEIKGETGGVVYCHCSMCRRQTGHFYATINLEAEQISIQGEEAVSWYQSSSRSKRGFCGRCGSALFWRENGTDNIAVLAGSLCGPSGLPEEAHIFVADKGDYYEIDDGLPQFGQSN